MYCLVLTPCLVENSSVASSFLMRLLLEVTLKTATNPSYSVFYVRGSINSPLIKMIYVARFSPFTFTL